MANSPQSKKRARQNERRLAVNKARRSRIRTFLRKVEEAIASGDKDAATSALRAAQPELMRGVTKGVFHKNTASRKNFAPVRTGQSAGLKSAKVLILKGAARCSAFFIWRGREHAKRFFSVKPRVKREDQLPQPHSCC